MKLITKELEKRFNSIGDQSEVKDPIIIAKFFDPAGAGTWYATEYDSQTNSCYGYVTGLGYDEWGSFSIDELEAIKRPFGLSIERDVHFKENKFSQLSQNRRLEALKNTNNKEKDKDR